MKEAGKWISILLAVTLALTGCGIRPTGIIDAGDPPLADHEHSPNTLYFRKAGKLIRVLRPGLDGEPVLAFEQLGRGPTALEQRRGITSAIPHGRLHVVLNGATVSVLLGLPSSRVALAQVACTAAAIPGVTKIEVYVKPSVARSYTCDDFRDLR